MKKTNLIILCVVISLVAIISAAAAGGREMYENGLVSDEGIPHGDIRDGIVSDESHGNMLGDMKDEIDKIMPRTGDGVVSNQTSVTTAPAETADNGGGSGAALAILIAVIVAIAVIVIIFVVMPKLK